MTIMEFQANMIEQTAMVVGLWIETTHGVRADWSPATGVDGAAGRSVLDQVGECVRTNRRFTARLRGEQLSPPDPDAPQWTPVSLEEAKAELIASAGECAAVVRAQDDSFLTEPMDMGGSPWPGATLVGMIPLHMIYHGGQICYIQTLYGDLEFRTPGGM